MACVIEDSFIWRRSALVRPRVMENALLKMAKLNKCRRVGRRVTYLILVESRVHYTFGTVGELANVAAEEDWVAGFDHPDNGVLHVLNLRVDI